MLAHPPYLKIQTLGYDYPESVFAYPLRHAGPCDRIQDGHSCRHALDEPLVHGLVHGYDVFFLMTVPGPHQTVDQLSFVGEQEQPF
ncbi:hypothetical protein SDC9_190037 [bioreactor metagenome]|uniref:Uncharacterized protein n=1 Tax=bioreactor metagenome TaxID=1076179 RepID=A0A645HUE3_9ZZZZ